RLGQYEEVIYNLDSMIRSQPTAENYFLRDDSKHKLKNFSGALTDYDAAKMKGYVGTELFLHRGICRVSLQMFSGAREDLNTYIGFNERSAKAYYWLGAADYMEVENYASIEKLDVAIMLDSAYADAYYLRAANYAELRKYNKALADYGAALTHSPQLYQARLNMARVYLETSNYQSAEEILSELRLEPIDFVSDVYYYRGEARYRMKDEEGACKDWKEAAGEGDLDAKESYEAVCLNRDGKPKYKKQTYFEF
ncbi:MAG: tetratricopeptide repeat protein, partial [Flavobacteriales bacterium]